MIGAIRAAAPIPRNVGETIGVSRAGRPLRAFRVGAGPRRVSLLAGCHADEPVGPRLLRHLCSYLDQCPTHHPLLAAYEWWLIPHINPDGEARNRAWHGDADEAYDVARYLRHVVRAAPGDDIEFGLPGIPADRDPRTWPRTTGGAPRAARSRCTRHSTGWDLPPARGF